MALITVSYVSHWTDSRGIAQENSNRYMFVAADPDAARAMMVEKFREWWPSTFTNHQITGTAPSTLADFWDVLNGHDWYYMMADDGSVYRRGLAATDRINALAAEGGPTFKDLLERFTTYKFSGPPWDSPQAQKPPRPE